MHTQLLRQGTCNPCSCTLATVVHSSFALHMKSLSCDCEHAAITYTRASQDVCLADTLRLDDFFQMIPRNGPLGTTRLSRLAQGCHISSSSAELYAARHVSQWEKYSQNCSQAPQGAFTCQARSLLFLGCLHTESTSCSNSLQSSRACMPSL